MLRLLFRLFIQRLEERRARHSLRQRKPEWPNQSTGKSSRRRLFTAAAGILVLSFAATLLIVNRYDFNLPLIEANRDVAKLLLQVNAVDVPPVIAFIERWPPPVQPVPESAAVTRISIEQNLFVPTFQLAPPGSALEIVNKDRILHNAHVVDEDDTVFNVATPLQSVTVRKTLTATGMLNVRCDLHPWMHAWIFVPPNAHYAVVREAGKVEWSNIEAGRYRLRLWQAGKFEVENLLRLAPGDVKTLDLL